MPINGYLDTIFATAGDVTTVPDPTQSNGTVSYSQGFPVSYSTPVSSGGYNFPRGAHNQILKDITTAIQFLQQNGASNFITSAMNNGSSYPYNLGAVVMYNAGGGLQSWISTANNNTTTPGAGGAFWIPLNGSGRQILASTTNFYVAPSGNDSTGNGTSGAPWLTLQHAYNYIAQNVDIAGQQCLVNAADNTNYAPLLANIPTVGGSVIFIGDTTTPTNCVINSTSGDCFSGVGNGISLFVKGFSTISNSGSGDGGVSALSGANVTINGNMNFGPTASLAPQIYAGLGGVMNFTTAAYSINGNANQHICAQNGGIINMGDQAVTLSGTPAYASGFAEVDVGGIIVCPGLTFSGSATGPRYAANTNGVIQTNGGGPNFFPGSSAGTTNNGLYS